MSTIKSKLGFYAAQNFINNNTVIGLGTGSTAEYFIKSLAERYHKEKLDILCIPSSENSARQAQELGLPIDLNLNNIDLIDITIDGADEIDLENNIMVKGGGGALLREKILASNSKKVVIIADDSKFKKKIGAFGLPIAVSPLSYKQTISKIELLGFKASLRMNKENSPFLSDDKNHIVDIELPKSKLDLHNLNRQLKDIPGVIETGLFIGLGSLAIKGCADNIEVLKFKI